jgi:acyl-coenzyme A synthetase/AMP-(fatty) acid ligase
VPALFGALLGLAHLATIELGALRLLTNAAAALPQEHVRRLRATFPAARLLSMYGMTECIRASYLPAEELDLRPGSVGRGIPGQTHWLIDAEGRRLPHGSRGELVVQGRHVTPGYWERPEETAARIGPGPVPGERTLCTGDLFRTDADGYLYFVARQDDLIKTAGMKVAPREVEEAIYALAGVTGCAVVGVADEALGEIVKAYVTLRPGATVGARDIVRHCLAVLENYMAPKLVEIVAELPRTESGKIRHASLRQRDAPSRRAEHHD